MLSKFPLMHCVRLLQGGLTMPVDEYMKAACWIVCPMCDEPKCVGRFNCPEIKAWIEKKRRADDEDLQAQ